MSKKSCKEDEYFRFYRFYHKFKQNKSFIGHDVMMHLDSGYLKFTGNQFTSDV